MAETDKFAQGFRAHRDDETFSFALEAAVDYRGDTTLELEDSRTIEGYLFDYAKDVLYVYPKDESDKIEVPVAQLVSIHFSGVDTALGKSWEEWIAKKKKEQEAQ